MTWRCVVAIGVVFIGKHLQVLPGGDAMAVINIPEDTSFSFDVLGRYAVNTLRLNGGFRAWSNSCYGPGCVKTCAHQQIDDCFSGWLAASVYPVRRCARAACLKAFERRRARNRESRKAQAPANCIAFIVLAIPNTLITRLKL